jgi:magnesium transporter
MLLFTIVPLNLIASIGGMSEWSMMTVRLDWRLSYGLFCLGMVLLGWGMWVFMKKTSDRGTVRTNPGRR